LLNDTNGFHVRDDHVFQALANAHAGAVDEANVGGGTGIVCHGFKGGIGTASRVVDGRYVVGIARIGGLAEHGSGDLILTFSTGNEGLPREPSSVAEPVGITMLPSGQMNSRFQASVEATEEAIVNALVAAETMTGRDGITAHRLPHDRLREWFST
jgi:L-aminopeptidase/D-esterase-like protein